MINEIYIEDVCSVPQISDEAQKLIEKVVNVTLEYEKIEEPCYVSITIVDENEIKQLNCDHRNIDKVTDVLSFPVVNLLDGSFEKNPGDYFEDKLILGDVVLCAKRAKEQSVEFGHSYERELGYLTCHSILHLIGYDHETEEEREVMREKEEAVMELVKLRR
ncbi:MAG: rRNA maturation RNase YbeY [Clostridia bacterium]|nr:rRNA maturation RNase YbeY [Clostridia bacterium]